MGDHSPLQAAAHTVKVLADGVGLGQEGVDALLCEHVVLGAQDDPDDGLLPRRGGDRSGPGQREAGIRGPEADPVPLGQLAALIAAHLVLQGGGPAAHHLGNVQPPGEGDIGPAAGFGGPQLQLVAGLHRHRLIHGTGLAIEGGSHVRAGDGDHIVRVEAEGGAQNGGLQGALPHGVAHQKVGGAEGVLVHGTGRGHAKLLISVPALVLNGGQNTGIFCGKAHRHVPLS